MAEAEESGQPERKPLSQILWGPRERLRITKDV